MSVFILGVRVPANLSADILSCLILFRRKNYLAEYPMESINSSSRALSVSSSGLGFLFRLVVSMSLILTPNRNDHWIG